MTFDGASRRGKRYDAGQGYFSPCSFQKGSENRKKTEAGFCKEIDSRDLEKTGRTALVWAFLCLQFTPASGNLFVWLLSWSPAQILNRKPFALRQDGQTTKLQNQVLGIHVGLFVMKLPYAKDSHSNKATSPYLPRFDETFFVCFLQFTVVPSYPLILS